MSEKYRIGQKPKINDKNNITKTKSLTQKSKIVRNAQTPSKGSSNNKIYINNNSNTMINPNNNYNINNNISININIDMNNGKNKQFNLKNKSQAKMSALDLKKLKNTINSNSFIFNALKNLANKPNNNKKSNFHLRIKSSSQGTKEIKFKPNTNAKNRIYQNRLNYYYNISNKNNFNIFSQKFEAKKKENNSNINDKDHKNKNTSINRTPINIKKNKIYNNLKNKKKENVFSMTITEDQTFNKSISNLNKSNNNKITNVKKYINKKNIFSPQANRNQINKKINKNQSTTPIHSSSNKQLNRSVEHRKLKPENNDKIKNVSSIKVKNRNINTSYFTQSKKMFNKTTDGDKRSINKVNKNQNIFNSPKNHKFINTIFKHNYKLNATGTNFRSPMLNHKNISKVNKNNKLKTGKEKNIPKENKETLKEQKENKTLKEETADQKAVKNENIPEKQEEKIDIEKKEITPEESSLKDLSNVEKIEDEKKDEEKKDKEEKEEKDKEEKDKEIKEEKKDEIEIKEEKKEGEKVEKEVEKVKEEKEAEKVYIEKEDEKVKEEKEEQKVKEGKEEKEEKLEVKEEQKVKEEKVEKEEITNKDPEKKDEIKDEKKSINVPKSESVISNNFLDSLFQQTSPLDILSMPVKTIQKQVSKVESICKVGYAGPGVEKKNQDNFFIYKKFLNNPELMYLGVCDGHGMFGHDISAYLVNMLPQNLNSDLIKDDITSIFKDSEFSKISDIATNTFVQTNINLVNNSSIDCTYSGSTCSSLIFSPEKIISINVGDSRCVLGKCVQDKWTAVNLTRDHKPTDEDEKKRILDKGGRIEPYKDDNGEPAGPERVWLKEENLPGLAMSRSFGDEVAHTIGVTSKPEIMEFKLSEEDKFIMLASDGIFEFISSDEAVNLVKDYYLKGKIKGALHNLYKISSQRWITEEGVIDDISLILVFLK